MSDQKKLTPVQAIKAYFEQGTDRKVGMDELKSLTPEERKTLADLCAPVLGVEITV